MAEEIPTSDQSTTMLYYIYITYLVNFSQHCNWWLRSPVLGCCLISRKKGENANCWFSGWLFVFSKKRFSS